MMYIDPTLARYATLPILLSGVVISVVVYTASAAIYNIYFHPLSKYPGSKLRASFHWPWFWNFWIGRDPTSLRELHEKYGRVVRVAPNRLSYTTAQAWKDIYGFRHGKGQLQKDLSTSIGDSKTNGAIINSNDADHARGRRVLAHAFSDSALRSQEGILLSYFDLLVEKLQEQIRSPEKQGKVDMVSWYNFTTFDVIGDLALGESFHALEDSDYHPWIRNIFKWVRFGRVVIFTRQYTFLGRLLNMAMKLFPVIRADRAGHDEFTQIQTKKRISQEGDRKDFMHYILQGNDKLGLSEREIMANVSLLIVAGSETTATLLSGATFHLLRNPTVLAKLQREVRSAFSTSNEINLIATAKLPYLHAVLEESLRMYPPVPLARERIIPLGGDVIDGRFVPGSTVVGVHQLATYYSTWNFAEPNTFAPERWLDGDLCPDTYKNDDRTAMQAFSIGPRNCLGKNLAYNEMRAILARIIWNFEMELCEESARWDEHRTWLLREKPPLWVQLSKRHDI